MSEASPHAKVAYVRFELSSPSDIFIARQLSALRRYEPCLLAMSAPDPMGLPAEAIHTVDRLNPLARGLSRLAFHLSHHRPQLESLVRRESCRVIHALGGAEGLSSLRAKARTGLPLVTSFLGADISRASRRNPQMYQELLAAGDLFLVSSQVARKALLSLGCPDDRLQVLHPAVDLDEIPYQERQPDDDGSINVLMVGQLVERKGVSYALRAFANASRYHRHVTLTVIGDGPERSAVESLIRELDLRTVRLLGAQPHSAVLNEMQRAHIMIQSSITTPEGDSEDIPISLIEAQAAGIPVISTWHAGAPDLVVDSQSGFLVSERNAHALAERLRHLIEHPELWRSFGQAGRARVEEQFNLSHQVAALEGYYDALLAGGSGA